MLQRIQEQQNLGLFIRSKSKPLPREHPEKQYIIQTKWESPTFRVKKSLVYSLLDTGWRSVDANLFNFICFNKDYHEGEFCQDHPLWELKTKDRKVYVTGFLKSILPFRVPWRAQYSQEGMFAYIRCCAMTTVTNDQWINYISCTLHKLWRRRVFGVCSCGLKPGVNHTLEIVEPQENN